MTQSAEYVKLCRILPVQHSSPSKVDDSRGALNHSAQENGSQDRFLRQFFLSRRIGDFGDLRAATDKNRASIPHDIQFYIILSQDTPLVNKAAIHFGGYK